MADMSLQSHAERLRSISKHILDDGYGGCAETCAHAADAIDAHLAQPAQAADARAVAYAERLARMLWQEHYAEDAPQWEPLAGDLLGLLSQIDNMASGLTRAISNVQEFN